MRERLLIVPPIAFGLASFGLQALALFRSHTAAQDQGLGPLALLFGGIWFALAILAWFKLERRRWWAFAPAPLVLTTPLMVLWLIAACSITSCDL